MIFTVTVFKPIFILLLPMYNLRLLYFDSFADVQTPELVPYNRVFRFRYASGQL